MIRSSRINEIKGVGEKTEKLFLKLGVETVGDLLEYFPRTYSFYEEEVSVSELREGDVKTVSGMLFGKVQVSRGKKVQITTVHIKDLTGTLPVYWYRMPFLRSTFSRGGMVTLRGKVSMKKNKLTMEQPEIFYPPEAYDEKRNSMQPVYALTAGLSNRMVSKAMEQILHGLDLSKDILPAELRRKYKLAEYNYAVRTIHFPQDKESYYQARNRLVFQEFLFFILELRKLKSDNIRMKNEHIIDERKSVDAFIRKLPFDLTAAQKKVWEEIADNMASDTVMSRLVQGDVGSGKTIVAVLALLNVAFAGCQGAMMAPTEVLARQHFENISKMFEDYGLDFEVVLLTGSMTAAQKREVYRRIREGEASVIIGTHALIQEKVEYNNLALVVTDEQHRFGVKQREMLAGKGGTPHILVMSATPIPRTLAIILYGELEVSVIDQLPANRLPIKNCVVDTGYRAKAYAFMKKQISEGRQCYVICPMVEESEAMEGENVLDYSESLQDEMGPDIVVACLHGRMKQDEKDRIMNEFSENKIQILVSTTVIEVGIDVPNSTVMMIENAERFGLAQLHQLRGRVGRGEYQSYCIFMAGSPSEKIKERLDILNHSNDGFKIANEDLRLRGPGDLFGIRQSGLMNFKLGDVFQDAKLLQLANEAADWIIKNDDDFYQKIENNERNSSVII